MKKFLYLLSLIYSLACSAQNYQCLQNGVKHYFTNNQGYLRGIRIDSIHTAGSDIIYYPFHTPRGSCGSSMWSYLDSNAGCWLGKKVIGQADGTFLFDNYWHDTVVIKTQANTGDTWIFFRDTGTSIYYKATLTSIDTMSVLGITDSVKKITVTTWDGTTNLTSDPMNNTQLILSKNYGFAQIIDLFMFPYGVPGSLFYMNVDFYTDAVYTDVGYPYFPRFGFPNFIFRLSDFNSPTYAQLYQWHSGDVYEYTVSLGNLATDVFTAPIERYYIDSITGVASTPDSTQYFFNGIKYIFNGVWHPPSTPNTLSYAYYDNNEVLVCNSQLVIDTLLMPEEYGQQAIYYYLPSDSSFCMTSAKYGIFVSGIRGGTYTSPFESSYPLYIYKQSLGLVTEIDNIWSDGNGNEFETSQKLIHYSRSGVYCGAIITPPTLINETNNSGFTTTISPNPVHKELKIAADKITSVAIFNIVGQLVFAHSYDASTVSINVSDLASGTYLIRLNGIKTTRFCKE
jgi:hypothetical protein